MRADGRVVTLAIDTPLRLDKLGTSPQGEAKKNHKVQERLPSGGAVACKATERGLFKALTSNRYIV